LHIVGFRDGKAFYRNRFIRTDGFLAENEAGEPLWPGLAEPVQLAKRDEGWGARTRMKDASSTDVIVHRGVALTSFYQCGDLYRIDPFSADTLGKETWNGHFPVQWGVSAHPKVDPKSGELLFFNYSKQAPYMHYGVVDENNDLAHYVDVPLPGPRLPHDMAFTENYVILNDFPLFWDPDLLAHDVHLPRFYPDMPSRFAVLPRRGRTGDIRWFEADPTFVLHFTNAYEDGDEIVLDGFYEGAPQPLDTGWHAGAPGAKWDKLFRFLALDRLQARLHRWRFNLVTGEVKEEQLSESITEFGTITLTTPPATTATPMPPPASQAGSCSTGWSSTTCEPEANSTISSPTGSSEVRPRWPRGRTPRRRRRLPDHADHRHGRRRVLLRDLRRRPVQRRPGMQNCSARTNFQRHPRHLGAGCAVAPLA